MAQEETILLRATSGRNQVVFPIERYFDNLTVLDDTTVNPAKRDVECRIDTSPAQKINYTEGDTSSDNLPAIRNTDPALEAEEEDLVLITASRHATAGTAGTDRVNLLNAVTVNAAATNAAGTGQFTLTITCQDPEVTVTDSAVITVRP